jgi:hypothetical protein
LDETTLGAAERRLGFPLPPRLKQFYLQTNGGQPRPNCLRAKGIEFILHQLFSIQCDVKFPSIDAVEFYKQLIHGDTNHPKGLFPVASDPGGDLICCSCEHNDPDHIYVVRYDFYNSPEYIMHINDDIDQLLEIIS